MSTTLPIPSRHPARLQRTKCDETTTQATSLTSEQLDVWEHAAVLYHGFDWQTSAETFLFLSRTINRNLESTLCLLNAAMIFARLGEYSTASQILDEAEPSDQTLALTMFIMGHVEFELGNFEKAEDSLKVALHSSRGSSQQFHKLGLEFVLRPSHIQQNLRIFESKVELVGMLGTLGSLPADGVFQAPSRFNPAAISNSKASTINSRNSMDSGDLPALSEDQSSPSEPCSPIESVQSLEYGSDGLQWHGLPDNPEIQVVEPTKATKTTTEQSSGLDYFSQVMPAFRKARKLAFEPREARVQGDSVRGLASFIRTLPSQGKKQEPKEARVKDESMMKLAEFFRTSAPEGTAALRPTDYDDNASEGSVYSDHSDVDSVRSVDLRNLVDDKEYSVKYRAAPPPASKHPYRSGFGSMLTQENMPNAAAQKTNAPFEASRMNSDTLHDLLCDSDTASMDWPLTDEASRSLRRSVTSAASFRTEIRPARTPMNRSDVPIPAPLRPRNDRRSTPPIPSRSSSLFRRQKSDQGSRERPTSTVSSSRFFSHVANLR